MKRNNGTTPTVEIKLFDIMIERNLSVHQLSELTGLTEQGLYLIINRPPRQIHLATLGKICSGLGISPNDLLELKNTEVSK